MAPQRARAAEREIAAGGVVLPVAQMREREESRATMTQPEPEREATPPPAPTAPTMLLLLDTETTGTDESATCIEVACALYSVEHSAVVRSFASLIRAESNPARLVNGIADALLLVAPDPAPVWHRVREMVSKAGAIVTHNAAFDRRFVPADIGAMVPWICSMDDITWPRASRPGEGLVSLALAHGLGIVSAHRADADVDTLARLLIRVAEMGADVPALLARALRPKALFVALVPFERNHEAKGAGFRWNDPIPRAWSRTMAKDDAAALPFAVREVAA